MKRFPEAFEQSVLKPDHDFIWSEHHSSYISETDTITDSELAGICLLNLGQHINFMLVSEPGGLVKVNCAHLFKTTQSYDSLYDAVIDLTHMVWGGN